MNSGRYVSAGEVVREALRLIDERGHSEDVRLAERCKAVQNGGDGGEPRDGDVVADRSREETRARKRPARVSRFTLRPAATGVDVVRVFPGARDVDALF